MICIDYDQSWLNWLDMKKYGPMSRHVRRLILNQIANLNAKTILDVGCGEGSLLAEIHSKKRGAILYGLDLANSALKFAKQKVPTARFYLMDIARDYVKKKFALVICSEVLEHLEEDQEALSNIAKMSNNYLLITTLKGKMKKSELSIGHVRNYQLNELIDKLEQAGFKTVKIIQWGFPFYSPLYRKIFNNFGAFPNKITLGKYNFWQKCIAKLIYLLFYLNSSSHGDQIIILSKK